MTTTSAGGDGHPVPAAPIIRPISKVLIANRGEIAVRIARACRDAGHRLGRGLRRPRPGRGARPGRRRGLRPRRLDARASPTSSSTSSSTSPRRSGADAVHPGYGFLAENAHFAQAVIDAGLIWIGPPPAAIDALGDKVKARHIAQTAGAPLVPGTAGPGVRRRRGRRVRPGSTACRWRSRRRTAAAAAASRSPGPSRRSPTCTSPRSARPSPAFGRGECFVERFLDHPRHVETQCLADAHGDVVVVSTRDCSLQRRHQKLVEEAPAPFLSDAADRRAVPGVQGDPARGRLRRRGHLRVPRRPGRHDLLPRGEHPAPGRALRLRGGQRDRPGPRAVPDRRRRAARLRRPAAARALDRVPDQRRGRRPQLPAPARHGARCGSRRAAPASGWTPASSRARSSAARSTRCSPSSIVTGHDRQPGHRAGPAGAGRVRRRGHADRHPVPPRGRRRPGVRPGGPRAAVHASTPGGSRPSSTTRSRRGAVPRPTPSTSRATGEASSSRSAASGSRSSLPAGFGVGGGFGGGAPPPGRPRAGRRAAGRAPGRPGTPSRRRCRARSSRSRSRRARPSPPATCRRSRGDEDGAAAHRPQGGHGDRARGGRRPDRDERRGDLRAHAVAPGLGPRHPGRKPDVHAHRDELGRRSGIGDDVRDDLLVRRRVLR